MTHEVLERKPNFWRRRLARALNQPIWWAKGTRVLLVAIPKCGTHVVRELLFNVGLVPKREILQNEQATADDLRLALDHSRGFATVGHIVGSPAMLDAVARSRAAVVFIIRDPRGYAVSLLYHIRRNADHALYAHFRDHVHDNDDGLMIVIRGINLGAQGYLPDVNTFFHWYLPWTSCPQAYITRFEDLIGPAGGGSAEAQRRETRNILEHIGYWLRWESLVAAHARRLFTAASPTFRSGQIDDWKRHFTERHKVAFKEVAGQLLIELGYERGLDW